MQHPDFENAAGVSLVKINTEKGKSFWEGFRDELETKRAPVKLPMQQTVQSLCV